jgi:hypothetical protein
MQKLRKLKDMKQNPISLGLAGVTLMCATAQIGLAQQAPGYGYQQPPQYSQPQYQPQYQVPPGYSMPQQQPSYPQQGYAPPQSQYVTPAQFLPTFGRKFGSMFRKLFYGDAPPAGYAQPAPGYSYPPQGRGSLDQPPQAYSQPYAAPRSPAPSQSYPPRYEVAPPPRTSPAPAAPPSSRVNSGTAKAPATTKKKSSSVVEPKTTKSKTSSNSTSERKYTPPSITREPTKPMVEDQPPEAPSSRSEPSRLPGSKPSDDTASKSTSKSTNGAANSGSFLRGKKASKEGRVISPYPPYRELDVSGLSSGSLALDPTTQKVFEVP